MFALPTAVQVLVAQRLTVTEFWRACCTCRSLNAALASLKPDRTFVLFLFNSPQFPTRDDKQRFHDALKIRALEPEAVPWAGPECQETYYSQLLRSVLSGASKCSFKSLYITALPWRYRALAREDNDWGLDAEADLQLLLTQFEIDPTEDAAEKAARYDLVLKAHLNRVEVYDAAWFPYAREFENVLEAKLGRILNL